MNVSLSFSLSPAQVPSVTSMAPIFMTPPLLDKPPLSMGLPPHPILPPPQLPLQAGPGNIMKSKANNILGQYIILIVYISVYVSVYISVQVSDNAKFFQLQIQIFFCIASKEIEDILLKNFYFIFFSLLQVKHHKTIKVSYENLFFFNFILMHAHMHAGGDGDGGDVKNETTPPPDTSG